MTPRGESDRGLAPLPARQNIGNRTPDLRTRANSAQGFTLEESAELAGITKKAIRWEIESLKKSYLPGA
jgi:hypothetical protein